MNVERLALWLSTTSVGTNVERFEHRKTAIQDALQGQSRRSVILTARLCLGYEVGASELSRFRTPFAKRDPFFPQRDNANELQVLASLILSELWERFPTSDSAVLSSLIVWAGLSISTAPLVQTEIKEVLQGYLRQSSKDARRLQVIRPEEAHSPQEAIKSLRRLHRSLDSAAAALRKQTYEEGLNDLVEVVEALQKSHSAILQNQLIIQEESNVLWWQTKLRDSEAKASTVNEVAELALSLSSLHEILPPLSSAVHLLCSVVPSGLWDPAAPYALVGQIDRKDREELVQRYQRKDVETLCPVLGHVAASLEVGEGEDYLPLIRHRFRGEVGPLDARQFASLLFQELILLKSLSKELPGGGDAQVQ